MDHLILIIEDNPDDREMVLRHLKRITDTCYRCIEAASGEQGLIVAEQHRPVCVLLDYSLPGQDGIGVLKRIREKDALLPVIMLTGQGNESIAVNAMKEGAMDYLVKSAITPETLQRSISSAIEYARMERKLREQRGRIQKQAEELELINEELETFTYIASHDLRSPLVNLKGFSGELHRSIDAIIPLLEKAIPHLSEIEGEILRKETCQRMPKSLAYIVTAAEKMDRLTDAILKLSRLGRKEIHFEPINTTTLVKQCLAALEHQIQKTGTVVEMDGLPEIMGDRTSIEQVFGNLLDNALKYLDPSRPGHIRISGTNEFNFTVFKVEDNGRGIARDDLHKVFEIFRRAGDVANIPGEGMGMSYVRAIVKRHGGSIWCESTLGQGTTFYFTIAQPQANQEEAA